VAQLVAEIDASRTSNLSSAIRVWILDRLKRSAGQP
jgi:predicted DNA-binding ribbon-helix-helix protein